MALHFSKWLSLSISESKISGQLMDSSDQREPSYEEL